MVKIGKKLEIVMKLMEQWMLLKMKHILLIL